MSCARILLVALVVSAATPPDEASRVARAIDDYATPLVARGDLCGQLLVFRRGKLLVERCWGFAERETKTAVVPTTGLNIASVTKPMTTVLALGELQSHHFALRDSIARWLPDFPHGNSITIGQLLSHRSGIPHEAIPDSEMTRQYSSSEVVDRLARMPLDFPPGTRSQYSSGGFIVLTRVLELVMGRSYGTLVDERLFEPLGMSHSWEAGEKPRTGEAVAYVPGPGGIERVPRRDFSALIGAGSVWSTARDLHRFVDAIVSGKLGKTVRANLVRDGRLDFSGRTGGFKAYAVWDSVSSIEYEFLSNTATGAPDALKDALPRLALGERVEPPALPALRPGGFRDDEMRRLTGVYRLENGTRLEVHSARGALWCNDWLLLPTESGGLFSPTDYGFIRPAYDSTGAVVRLDWTQGGTTYPAPRESH